VSHESGGRRSQGVNKIESRTTSAPVLRETDVCSVLADVLPILGKRRRGGTTLVSTQIPASSLAGRNSCLCSPCWFFAGCGTQSSHQHQNQRQHKKTDKNQSTSEHAVYSSTSPASSKPDNEKNPPNCTFHSSSAKKEAF
jgi:hypothetical protein